MDGGGRVLRSMTAMASPIASAHALPRAAFAGAAGSRSAARRKPDPATRRPVPVVASRRTVPRFLGSLLLLTLFLGVGTFGVIRGGEYDDFIARNGPVREMLAR